MNILVLGIGNLLLSDEAVGVRIIEALERRYRFSPQIDILDGGTSGMELMEAMAGRDHLIVADAVLSGQAPGRWRYCATTKCRRCSPARFPRTSWAYPMC